MKTLILILFLSVSVYGLTWYDDTPIVHSEPYTPSTEQQLKRLESTVSQYIGTHTYSDGQVRAIQNSLNYYMNEYQKLLSQIQRDGLYDIIFSSSLEMSIVPKRTEDK